MSYINDTVMKGLYALSLLILFFFIIAMIVSFIDDQEVVIVVVVLGFFCGVRLTSNADIGIASLIENILSITLCIGYFYYVRTYKE